MKQTGVNDDTEVKPYLEKSMVVAINMALHRWYWAGVTHILCFQLDKLQEC